MITRRIFLPTQVEDFDAASSHYISLSIRQKIYYILAKFENFPKKFTVKEYDRLGTEQRIFKRKLLSCDIGINLDNIDRLTVAKRKQIFHQIVDIKFNADSIPDDNLKAIFYCIIFWITEKKRNEHNLDHDEKKFSLVHVKAMFLSIIRCYCVSDEKVKHSKLNKTFKRFKTIDLELDKQKIHCFIEFQSIYLAFSWLNDLLDRPLNFIEPSHIISGLLLYKLTSELEKKDQSLSNDLPLLSDNKQNLMNKVEKFWYAIEYYLDMEPD